MFNVKCAEQVAGLVLPYFLHPSREIHVRLGFHTALSPTVLNLGLPEKV